MLSVSVDTEPRLDDRGIVWSRLAALVTFSSATVLLIPVEWMLPGLLVWAASALIVWRSGDPLLRRNMGILLLLILMLGFAPINTDLSNEHFIELGTIFLIAVLAPYLYMRWKAPHQLDWRFWPREFSWRDVIYTAVSIPLAWGIIWLYFFYLTPDLALNWPMPEEWDQGMARRLVIGINCVGIWDEFFFVNTVFVLMRPLFSFRVANLGQAVVYTSVLNDMAFTGWGPVIVYGFALTQGVMYEKSRVLLWVLIVHLIVDVFLVIAILRYYYPDGPLLIK